MPCPKTTNIFAQGYILLLRWCSSSNCHIIWH